MSNNISIKKDEESGEYFIDIKDLEHLFEDPSIVDSYSMETRDDGSIVLEFFDKDGTVININKK